jgi:Resolvase, N terminal domain
MRQKPDCENSKFCSIGRHPRFAGDFRLKKSVAKGQYFATIFATVGSDVMNIGYARVSTLDQNLDLQIQALKKVGCNKIFREKVSGSSRERPELQRMLDQLRHGDTVIVRKLDRLARSTRDLLETDGNRTGGWRSLSVTV